MYALAQLPMNIMVQNAYNGVRHVKFLKIQAGRGKMKDLVNLTDIAIMTDITKREFEWDEQ